MVTPMMLRATWVMVDLRRTAVGFDGDVEVYIAPSTLAASCHAVCTSLTWLISSPIPVRRPSSPQPASGDCCGAPSADPGHAKLSSASLIARSSTHRGASPPPGSATPASVRQSASPSTVKTCHAMTRPRRSRIRERRS